MNATDLSAFIIIIGSVFGTILAFLKLRSEIIVVKPEVITSLEDRATELSDRLDKEVEKRRELELNSHNQELKAEKLSVMLEREINKRQNIELRAKNQKLVAEKLSVKLEEEIKKRRELEIDARNRIRSLEENDVMNQKSLKELHSIIDKYSEGIQILIKQIERDHNGSPDWRPGDG